MIVCVAAGYSQKGPGRGAEARGLALLARMADTVRHVLNLPVCDRVRGRWLQPKGPGRGAEARGLALLARMVDTVRHVPPLSITLGKVVGWIASPACD